MAVYVYKNAYVKISTAGGAAGVVTTRVNSVAVSYGAESQDVTAMGSNTRKSGGGLKTWSVEMDLFQDHSTDANTGVDKLLYPLVGSTRVLAIKPTTSAKSATNPEFTGTALLESYTPLQGAVGVMAKATATWVAAGDLSRNTT